MIDAVLQASETLGTVAVAVLVTVIVFLKYGPGSRKPLEQYEGPDRRVNSPERCVVTQNMKDRIYSLDSKINAIQEIILKEDPNTTRKLVHFPTSFEQSIIDLTAAVKSLTEAVERMPE